MEFLFHVNGVKESCNFENIITYQMDNTHNIHKIFRDGGKWKNYPRKNCLKMLNSDQINWKMATPKICWNRL